MAPPTANRASTVVSAIGGEVRAPFPMTQRLRRAGLNAVLVPSQVPADVLSRVFGSPKLIRNLDGLVITVPHKMPMAELVDHSTERARLVGAINGARREADGLLKR
jgi:shikimate dehydrogenase